MACSKALRPAASGFSIRATTSGPNACFTQSRLCMSARSRSVSSISCGELPCARAYLTIFSAEGSQPPTTNTAIGDQVCQIPFGLNVSICASANQLSPVQDEMAVGKDTGHLCISFAAAFVLSLGGQDYVLPVRFLVDFPAGISVLDGCLHDPVHAQGLRKPRPVLWRADAFLDSCNF
jgi:hypothetical protein